MHYLDYASHAPIRPEVAAAVHDAMLRYVGDPGRIHHAALATRSAIEQAREQVAKSLGVTQREVIFTATGTEAVNAAIFGAAQHGSVVRSAVEHSAVRDALRRAPVSEIVAPVDGLGRVDPDEMLGAIRADTKLVCIQFANPEVATLQPVATVVAGARDRGILTFVDARPAYGYALIDLTALGADLCAITAHTAGGPTGIGALIVRRGLRIEPLIVGGAQERARRAGMEHVAGIVGFGTLAATLTPDQIATDALRYLALTDALAAIATNVPEVVQYGDHVDRLANIVCFGVGGVEAEPVLLGLDQRGIAAHSGSACSSEIIEPSPVLAAMGVDADQSLRLSVGWNTTDDDVRAFARAFPEVVASLRALRLEHTPNA
ncbi:MAG: cysteine desulfurase family protein [Acidimicrobiia bacterium]